MAEAFRPDLIDGLETANTFRIFVIAGHQIVFSFDVMPLEIEKKASIYVKGLGRVTFSTKAAADNYMEGVRWLESLDNETARKALEYLWGRIKPRNG